MTRSRAILFLLIAGVWTSCIKDQYDFSQVPDINVGPFITPVAKVNFSLADFLEDADSTGSVFASESGALMAAATIATSGRVIEPGFNELEIIFDGEALSRIDKKTELRIRVEFESPDAGDSPFIVHYSNFLNLYIATQVELSTTL